MHKSFNFKDKRFVVYGLGLTGQSVVKFLKKNKAKSIFTWDDKFKNSEFKKKKLLECLKFDDHIIISPGVNVNKSKFKKLLIVNKRKFLSDIDLFFLKYNAKRTVMITGTNGKSTTCSILSHVLKKNKIRSTLVGNIGTPILKVKFSKKNIYIIEASSFQLEYSKYIKPYCAALLNITDDHLDWHGTKKKYIRSKFKIFENQTNSDLAFIKDINLRRIYKKRKLLGKLKLIKKNLITPNNLNNKYLKLEANKDNISFAYSISKIFKIKKKKFVKSLDSFKGLPHRHEIFFNTRNCTFINDSKATSFEAAKYALNSNDNIIWILGGLPKEKDKFFVKKYRGKIIKAYIIGKRPNYFVKQLKNSIKFEVNRNLNSVIYKVFKSLNNKKTTVLFSPASASYDQYKSFVDRGEKFKKLVKLHAKKFH